VRLGIYQDDGTFYPGALLLDAGTVAAASTGEKSITGLTQVLQAGTVYWLVAAPQGAGGTVPICTAAKVPQTYVGVLGDMAANAGFLFGGSASGQQIGFKQASVSGALPSNFTTTHTKQQVSGTADMVLVVARAA
jgi:hypothetical protein